MAIRNSTDEALQNPDVWDAASDTRLPSVANPLSDVVITLNADELERIDRAAERSGENLIEFILRVVLEHAEHDEARATRAS